MINIHVYININYLSFSVPERTFAQINNLGIVNVRIPIPGHSDDILGPLSSLLGLLLRVPGPGHLRRLRVQAAASSSLVVHLELL